MKNGSNLKVRTTTLMAFGSIILLACCVVIGLLFTMNAIAKGTQDLYARPYTANDEAWKIRRNILDTKGVLYRYVAASASDDVTASSDARATYAADVEDMQKSIDHLEEMFTSADKVAALDGIKSQLTDAAAAWEKVYDLIDEGQTASAMNELTTVYEPLVDQLNHSALNLAADISDDAEEFATNAAVNSRMACIVGAVLLIIGVIFSVIVSLGYSSAIVRPLKQLEYAANEMSRGNLSVADSITYVSGNELGTLAESLRVTMRTLSAYVNEISANLMQLSKGDLTISRDTITDYLGDFSEIKGSFVTILKNFNTTLGSIHGASEQVSVSSDQVAGSAQGLSQGATEQASAVDELASTLEEVSAQIKETAENANTARIKTEQAGELVAMSDREMQHLITAMTDIEDKSGQIGKIIKTIEDIAFQTNILALNAAVEAARAGAAGKGFAVVADEVRNLASKSAEASKNTAVLIDGAVQAIEKGTSIARTTADSLKNVVESTQQAVEYVDKIAAASGQEAEAIMQITKGVDQISGVVQNTSATAEESAAASEELSGQAGLLKNLVNRFRLFADHPNQVQIDDNPNPNPVRMDDMEPAAPVNQSFDDMSKY